jgi:Ca2+-binding RTX toxin-like protein
MSSQVKQSAEEPLELVHRQLKAFAQQDSFESIVTKTFGSHFDTDQVANLRQQWMSADFQDLPNIRIVSAATLQGARGAYSSQTNTIYLSRQYLAQNASGTKAIAKVLLHEIGHFVDSKINSSDSPGDEGAIFSALVSGKPLGAGALRQLRERQDSIALKIGKRTVLAEANAEPTTNLNPISDGLPALINSLKSSLGNQTLNGLPLLGDIPLSSFINQFLTNTLERRLRNALNEAKSEAGELTTRLVREALFSVLGSTKQGGLGLLQDSTGDRTIDINDIRLPRSSNSTQFSFKVGKSFKPDLKFTKDIGLPNLGLNLRGGTSANLNLSLDVSFGVDGSNGRRAFFVDTSSSNEFQVQIGSRLRDADNQPLKLGGSLGFLEVTATDNGSQFSSNFSADLTSSRADANGRLNFGGLTSLSVAPAPQLTASADLKFKLDTSASLGLGIDNGVMPIISTDFSLLNWRYDSRNPQRLRSVSSENSTAALTTSPTVDFKNVTLDLGSFVNSFAKPVLDNVNTVFAPFKPIINTVSDNRLPLVNRSLLELAQYLSTGALFGSGAEVGPDSLKLALQIAAVLDLINKIPSSADKVKLDLGDFNLSNVNLLTTNVSNISPTQDRVGSPVAQQLGSAGNSTAFFNAGVRSNNEFDNKLSFPILEPNSIIKLLLGQSNIDLFAYQTPQLFFDLKYESPPIPIFGPIVLNLGGGVGAGAQVKFGFDTDGLRKFKEGNFTDPSAILDGFFVSRPDQSRRDQPSNNLSLTGEIDAKVGVEVGIVKLSVGGGIGLTVELDAIDPRYSQGDPNYFKVRPSTLTSSSPFCIFQVNGALSFIIFATFRLRLGFFNITKRLNIPPSSIHLIDFTVNTGGCEGSIESHFNVPNPKITPEMERKFAEQGVINRQGTDGGDQIFVYHREGRQNFGGDEEPIDVRVELEGLPDPKSYANVRLVVISSGEGNDLIDLVGIVASGQLDGGAGNDVLVGALGDDFLTGGAGDDTLDGGGGERKNTAVYADSPAGVFVDLSTGATAAAPGIANDGHGTTDRLINIQNVEGSRYSDTLIANPAGSTLDSGEGNDFLYGGAGDDVLLGGAGADVLSGGGGWNTVTYIDSGAPVYVNISNRNAFFTSPTIDSPVSLPANAAFGGDAEGDRISNIANIQGSAYDDIIIGTDTQGSPNKENHLDGFFGNDILIPGAAAEIIDGGAESYSVINGKVSGFERGSDWVSYITSSEGVNVNLSSGIASGGYARGDKLEFAKDLDGNPTVRDSQGDRLSSIENIEGSNSFDTLDGDGGNNIIKGRSGDDTIFGRAGDDLLIGGAGRDSLNGGDNSSSLQANSNSFRDAGDTASYQDSPTGVSVSLGRDSTPGVGSLGDAEGDSLTGIENLIGSNYGDTLTGNNTNNDINPGLSNGGRNGEVDVVDGGSADPGSAPDIDRLTIDYSTSDYARFGGVFGGFGFGYLSRAGSGDRVNFFNIERLYIVGTSQRDEIYGGNDSTGDVLLTGAGDDFINGGGGSDEIRADDGNDFVVEQSGQPTEQNDKQSILYGGNGIDTLSIDLSTRSENITLQSSNITQENPGTNLALNGLYVGQFEIFKDVGTGKGNDILTQLNRVNNLFDTGYGSDIVNPGLGFDTVVGGDAEDITSPSPFPQAPVFGPNDDLLILDYSTGDTGSGMTVNITFSQDPTRQAGSAFRTVGQGQDPRLDEVNFSKFERFSITGTSKNDRLEGGTDADVLNGQAGNDVLFGSWGNDQLNGGQGDDQLIGTGNTSGGGEFFSNPSDIDTLTGGTGADLFVLGGKFIFSYARGGKEHYAVITDFKSNENDRIQMVGPSSGYFLRSQFYAGVASTAIYAGNPNISSGGDLVAILQNVTSISLNSSNFIYI